ncbi:ExeA family protein [Desulfocastanea catecholica]
MYLDHYHLKLMPFEIGPDPKFLWLGPKHKEAYAALVYGILESKGFIVIIGDPGTGKSTLLNATAANFGSNIRFAKITDPAMDEMDFFNFAANAFEMGKTFRNKAEFLSKFEDFVKEAGAQSKKVILVIDEAQRLTADMLEQIRVFSNVETPGQKVVSCIFAGQTEFLDMVKKNRALAQRVFFSHIIQPLTQSETADYITHRLKVAGTEKPIFTSDAMQEVFRLTDGIPRLINILCDQAMLSGYALDRTTIGPELIRESTENTLIPLRDNKEAAAETQRQGPSNQLVSNEPVAENTMGLTRNASAISELKIPRRKKAYWALIVLTIILGTAIFLYLSDGFRGVSTSSKPDPKILPQKDDQTAKPKPATAEIHRLQSRILELAGKKDDAEKRLGELQLRFGTLEKGNQQLKASIAELQNKLGSARPVQDQLKGEVETLKKENTRLQAQLVQINNQKGEIETQLNEVDKKNADLSIHTKELKSLRDRAVQLETAVAEREKTMSRLKQKIDELEKSLTMERATKDKMGAELISRQSAIADLEKRNETSRSTQLKLESDIQKTASENAQLQSQLQELKAKKTVLPSPPPPDRASLSGTPSPVSSDEVGTTADDPAGVIDFILKKKSQ